MIDEIPELMREYVGNSPLSRAECWEYFCQDLLKLMTASQLEEALNQVEERLDDRQND